MKKLVLSTVAVAMLATSASAVKIGVGTDILGGPNDTGANNAGQPISKPTLRVSIDGLVDGLRIEPRLSFATTNDGATTALTSSTLTFGIGAYYDVMSNVAVGLAFDTSSATTFSNGTVSAATGANYSNLIVSVKTEKELTKNLSIAYEIGLQMPRETLVANDVVATTTDSAMYPYSAVTMRLFF